MKKHIGVIICGLFLAGCATQRPPLPESRYADISRGWITLTECIDTGRIDAATGARGKAYSISTINGYQHNPDKLRNTEISMRNSLTVSDADCRGLAMAIEYRKQQIENQNDAMAFQRQEIQNSINSTKPTQTYCNKIGTQVLCNSF